jgi:epoxyqueuosine reductase
MAALEERLKEEARRLGFDLVGIATAVPADTFDQFESWLANGYAGDMEYMHRHGEARRHPDSILVDVRSVVMVAMNYNASDRESSRLAPRDQAPLAEHADDSAGCSPKIASYARAADYHDVLRNRLNELRDWVREQVPGCHGRGVVDTAPLLERDFARRAGLGWFGKNTMLLNKRLGSFFFLGALLLDIPLEPDEPHEASHCGTCTACLDACPTQAFVAPGVLDARRCLSYLTIELKGSVPAELRPALSDWLFGCDVCQDVCPWNHKAPAATEPAFLPRADFEAVDLVDLLGMSEGEFRRRFHGTAMLRTKRRGMLRNAALILGNRGETRALPALQQLLTDPDIVLRESAAWAIERIQERRRLARQAP